jgi:hypothetical protein
MRRDAGSRTVKLIVQPGRAAQLICPKCPHKPPAAWAALVNQARETVAAGRSHTYI